MKRPRHVHIAIALIRDAGRILLVRQQGPGDAAPYWALPGGRVLPGEFLVEGLVREVREETGLALLDVGELAYVARVDDVEAGYQSTTRVFEINAWHGKPRPADPDALILEAAFFPLAETIQYLEQIPWRAMRDPIVAYLRDEVPAGSVWLYRRQRNEKARLIARLT